MLWTSIGIEPAAFRSPVPQPLLATYSLHLPLVADGRIAFVQLRAKPEQARVIRFAPDEEDLAGTIRVDSGQWSIIWDHAHASNAPLPPVRFTGNRFLHGDPVGLRQAGWPMLIYRVCPPEQAAAAHRAA